MNTPELPKTIRPEDSGTKDQIEAKNSELLAKDKESTREVYGDNDGEFVVKSHRINRTL